MKSKDENIIVVKNAKKIYRMGKERIVAVDDVSFTIKKGEFCCLYGSSGSGKSIIESYGRYRKALWWPDHNKGS